MTEWCWFAELDLTHQLTEYYCIICHVGAAELKAPDLGDRGTAVMQ